MCIGIRNNVDLDHLLLCRKIHGYPGLIGRIGDGTSHLPQPGDRVIETAFRDVVLITPHAVG